MYYDLIFPNFNFAHKLDKKPVSNDEFADHFHMIYEILLFLRGDAEFIIENKKFALEPGSLLFIPAGQHHNIEVKNTVPYERYVIKFPEYVIPDSILPILRNKSGCFDIENTIIPELFRRMDEHVENYDGSDLCGLLKCVLTEILYYFGGQIKPQQSQVYNENMIDVLNYINDNISKKLTLNDICQHFHYSKSYICKEFSQSLKTSIMRYIRTKKILLADSLIKSGEKPIKVYELCGFSDYSTFFRAYKQLFGKSPSNENHF